MITKIKLYFFLQNQNFKKVVNVRKIILCNGGIESTSLILRSIKDNKLKDLRNKKCWQIFYGSSKNYVGVIKSPKTEIIEKIKLKKTKDQISYYGLSLTKKEQYSKSYSILILDLNKIILK